MGVFPGFDTIVRKFFRISNFRANFFWNFQLSIQNFSGFSTFEPEKIREFGENGELIAIADSTVHYSNVRNCVNLLKW